MLRSRPGDLTRTSTVLGSSAADARDASLQLRDAEAQARLSMPPSSFTDALEQFATAYAARLQSGAAAGEQLSEVARSQGRSLAHVNGLLLPEGP